MAHHRDIPIAYSYRSERRNWELCRFSKAELPKTSGETYTSLLPALRLPAPTPRLGSILPPGGPDVLLRLHRGEGLAAYLTPAKTCRIFGENINRCLETALKLQSEGAELPESLSQLLLAFPSEEMDVRELNPWTMRDEFLRLEETNAALLSFLSRWGWWERSGAFSYIEDEHSVGKLGEPYPIAVLPFLVWKRRKELRDGMLGKPDAWLANNAALGFTQRRSKYPYLGMTDTTCVNAIETTITLDHMRKTKWRICKRPDCGNIFAVESEHGKVYCEQYCAHLVSVRRNRAAAKRTKKAASRKGA